MFSYRKKFFNWKFPVLKIMSKLTTINYCYEKSDTFLKKDTKKSDTKLNFVTEKSVSFLKNDTEFGFGKEWCNRSFLNHDKKFSYIFKKYSRIS